MSIAKKNQKAQQQKKRAQQKRETTINKQQPRQHLSTRRRKQHTMTQNETKTKDSGKRKYKQSPNEIFLSKLRAASLQQSKLHMEKHQKRFFIRINEKKIIKSPSIEVIILTSDSTQNSPLKVYTSDNKYDFMVTSPNSPDIPTTFTSKISTPKIDKAVKKTQQINATPMTSNSAIENNAVPYGATQREETSPKNLKTNKSPVDNTQAPNPEASTSQSKLLRPYQKYPKNTILMRNTT